MKPAATKQKLRRDYRKHGDSYRQRLAKEYGIDAIDGRTIAGKIAKSWRRNALTLKGGRQCPYHIQVEIIAATFDLWRMVGVQGHVIADVRNRGTIINRRSNRLPSIHENYETISARFDKRCEALQLGKGGLDLARRIMLERATK